jgi:hypothetical protein
LGVTDGAGYRALENGAMENAGAGLQQRSTFGTVRRT